ncbi:hypothetical protein JDV02_005627 [Purpureocillium takamizusanense]|uniref:Extracellular metalloproteinase n=1 Tax=Purpureocillium takamizusanense TaxID=2060973 RepID=A0A9Q8VC17_9HYPO|nr:uncharacterized protein JDV02_005627 [Purpureocillium takamizusanense]UNI19444.1 hypothetical protein JDV02_005627 [Purpureocillium takamizusanense]
MKSFLLLSLIGLAISVQAHPRSQEPNESSPSKRGIDLEKFRLPQVSEYTSSSSVKTDSSVASINKRGDYLETAKELVKTIASGAEYRLVNDHYVSSDGIAFVHFKQTLYGIDIDNADFNVNVKDGKILSYGNSFFKGDAPKENLNKDDFSDPVAALKGAINTLDLGIPIQNGKAEAKDDKKHEFTIKGIKGAFSDPNAKLVYFQQQNKKLFLAWRVEIVIKDYWLLTYVDAFNTKTVYGVVNYVDDLATYKVYPWNVNNPAEGQRSSLKDPWNLAASPFTWNGAGKEFFTTTMGNNAVAHANPSGGNDITNLYRPTSPSRMFVYEYSPLESNNEAYRDASITQLFYTVNKYHDLLYILGFDEKAGNFQLNNNGKGGLDKDFVMLDAQDGSSTKNAYFIAPPDGEMARMGIQMWTNSMPARDGSFDTDIVLHEYTHGLSSRLTGGPSNAGCLDGLESSGLNEGWSDFMAIAVRIKATDNRHKDYTIASWAANKPRGIRGYPYSTSNVTNPFLYSDINKRKESHYIGTIWATILYEVIWNLIEKHGITDKDFPEFDSAGVPKDGRYLAMKLIMTGMAIQPCNPGMVAGRDAIIDADKALTQGANQCALWQAFAKRGLGDGAKFAGGLFRTPRPVDSFNVPKGVC